ncbi:MAG: haloacid dehalogenase-like hydrolase [Acidobacteriota bacterium]|nr:haloacid dehalogenase-like hydrolase [Acidobacteriota bacterium]
MSPTESPARTAKIFSTAEFHSAVHALAPRIAVFDCDGTLWSGDAVSGFMRWSIEQGLPSAEAISWLDLRYKAYLAGQVSEAAICGEMVQVYRGVSESDMRAAAATFFSTQIERNIFPEMLSLVHELQSSGTEIWAVSSTCDWVIEEGVKRFAIPASRVLAAHVAIDSGLVTDTILDVPTDQGKVAALARVGIAAPDAVFGNSIHDSNMLAIARAQSAMGRQDGTRGAFAVNPSPALLERSARENWPVYYPASVKPK